MANSDVQHTTVSLEENSALELTQDGSLNIVEHDNTVEITDANTDLNLVDSQTILVVKQNVDTLNVLSVGMQGPEGPPGASSEGAYELEVINFIVQNTVDLTYSLPNVPRRNSLEVFLNGLLENNESVFLNGNVINFPGLELDTGDKITLRYMYGVQ